MNFMTVCYIREVLESRDKMLLQVLKSRLPDIDYAVLSGMIEGGRMSTLELIQKTCDAEKEPVKIPEKGPAVVKTPSDRM